jgi:dihydrofolate synthase / folylpolyglutamate synthase
MTYAEAVDSLLGLPRFSRDAGAAYKPGLARILPLLEAMDQPQERYPIVHVAGTNGKGSTASMVAAIGTACGLRVGLHTSPHLVDLRERMRMDGVPAPEDWLAGAVSTYRGLVEESQASFFETTVALSLLYFAEREVDLAVVEVGLGGRLDATNIVQPVASIITQIGYDHQEFLGETIEEIAGEKAGIIKPGIPVFVSARDARAVGVLREAAARRAAPLYLLGEDFEVEVLEARLEGLRVRMRFPGGRVRSLRVGIGGVHQADNAAAAAAAAAHVLAKRQGLQRAIETGLRDVRRLAGLHGRSEVLREEPLIIADVAHNLDGLRSALQYMCSDFSLRSGRLVVLLGVMKDKDVDGLLDLMPLHEVSELLVVAPDTPRAASTDVLSTGSERRNVPVQRVSSVAEGVARFLSGAAGVDRLLITGSHLVVGALGSGVLMRR